MVMPAAHRRIWTINDLDGRPENGTRYEIIDGVLFVSPPPAWRHEYGVTDLLLLVATYVRTHRIGEVLPPTTGLQRGPRTYVLPDLFVVPLTDGVRPRDPHLARPQLVIEIVSPSTRFRDHGLKREFYQRHADLYWIVDLRRRVVHVWQPGADAPEVVTEELRWQPSPAHPPLVIDLHALFDAQPTDTDPEE
jgi:Uma2 family endonuclease